MLRDAAIAFIAVVLGYALGFQDGSRYGIRRAQMRSLESHVDSWSGRYD